MLQLSTAQIILRAALNVGEVLSWHSKVRDILHAQLPRKLGRGGNLFVPQFFDELQLPMGEATCRPQGLE